MMNKFRVFKQSHKVIVALTVICDPLRKQCG